MTSAKIDNLIKMANQISDNICHQSDDEETAKKVLNHIQLFWAKSMKLDIIAYYQTDGSELTNVAKLAIKQLV
ncbi:formate dehydrogenase subunit delta [Pseudoalteromonas denitrificans]|jgi:formate dehydrogenase subunit delta|uniref:Formate dehydrogenase subunit delta n=1 Tax=Pseudoalteromonas denitrificans DSM 6059 TaxID=1123010 RepID=A0A1I1LI15_9GAMM|nr:formate dehydrogenase subunit delta [Pseudoalteromonas denitrificans]SFC69130.1 formate dehydrogenase subunit delta [Pseudoalteromonas denitrificans DSM 6059]